MKIAYTTVENKSQALFLAETIIDKRLAACVQIDGPILSCYRWENKREVQEEYRLVIKCLASQEKELSDFIQKNHPYSCPEWVVVSAESVSPSYRGWASL